MSAGRCRDMCDFFPYESSEVGCDIGVDFFDGRGKREEEILKCLFSCLAGFPDTPSGPKSGKSLESEIGSRS